MSGRLATLAVLALLALPLAARAQTTSCAQNVPCQNVPWQMPALPRLPTPTIIPTVASTAISQPGQPTAQPTQTSNDTGYGLPAVDVSGLAGPLATVGALAQSTPVHISDLSGSYAAQDSADQLGQQAGTFFGYVRGLAGVNFGMLTPLFLFIFGGLFFTLGIKLTSVFLPVIAALVGIVRKVVSLILDFLPL